MTPEQLEKIGLPEDATDVQINERLDELASAKGDGDEDEASANSTETETTEDESESGTEPATSGAGETAQPQNFTPPAGTVLVDQKAHEATNQRLATVENQLAAQQKKEAEADRKTKLDAAQREGKFRAQDRAHYENLWGINAAETEKLVDALAPNTVPVNEIGHGGGADVDNAADDSYDRSALTPAERKRIDNIYAGQEA